MFYLLIFQFVNTATKAILALYRQEIEKAVEYSFHYERERNMAKIQAMKVEVEQAKKELAKEKGRISSLMEKIGKLKLAANIHVDHQYWAKEGQRRAEIERKEMLEKLAQVLSDQTFAEELLFPEQERSDDLSQELHVLQKQCKTTEKI